MLVPPHRKITRRRQLAPGAVLESILLHRPRASHAGPSYSTSCYVSRNPISKSQDMEIWTLAFPANLGQE